MKSGRMDSMLSVERNGRVVVATLSRPPVNALDDEMIERLDALLDEVATDSEATLLHLRSAQKAFCAGADLAQMQACFATAEGAEAMIGTVRRMQRLFARLETTTVVTLAEIGGAAVGGGLELALSCDLRVAAAEAKLGLPEASLGLLPAAGGTQRLARLCGQGAARRLIFGAELIDGVEAQRLGMVQWVQPRGKLAGWTRELAARIAAMSRAALLACKHCIAAAEDPSRDGFAEELAATRDLYDQADTRRRVSEFLSKRSTRQDTEEIR